MVGEPESGSALVAIHAEMARQAEDARESFLRNADPARAAAASLRRTGRAIILGMGGSHAVNRVVEPLYREARIDATAHPISEILYSPIHTRGCTVLVTSQSGESGEVIRYLSRADGGEERFGLTLDAESTLAKSVPSLIGHGGPERAFAATRSLYVSLALHARILHELGAAQDEALTVMRRGDDIDIAAAAAALASVKAVIFSGRAAMQGVAEAGALGLLELARMPSVALDGGQLRHGPLEALGAAVGVVLFRAADSASPATAPLANATIQAGSPTVIFDVSGERPVDGAITVSLPPAAGIAAALAVLPPLQNLLIASARRRVSDVGEPLRSSKVTRDA
jgi:fructoselysine-6-P-deglycase FrlB-like protein